MKELLDDAWNDLRFGKSFTGSSDITIMGLADLPEADRKRYEAMGFTPKPVELRVVPQVFEDIGNDFKNPRKKQQTRKSPVNRMHELTVEEYKRLKEDGKTDDEIIKMYGCPHNPFYKWKHKHGLTGGKRIRNNQRTVKKVTT